MNALSGIACRASIACRTAVAGGASVGRGSRIGRPARIAVLSAVTAAILGMPLAAPAAEDPALEARLRKLESELRCLVCQNQSLADSNAELAKDLRDEVRKLVQGGRSDAEIKNYLVARYGDFVLYRPPVKSTTWLLWSGPFLLLAVGGGVWWQVLRRRRSEPPAVALSEEQRALAKQLLDGDPPRTGA